jgi:hypothetical protein
MCSLYDLLNKIHQKPGVYIGAPSVSGLHLFLCGYAFSRQEQGLAITAKEQTQVDSTVASANIPTLAIAKNPGFVDKPLL